MSAIAGPLPVSWVRQSPVFNTSGDDQSPNMAVDLNGNSYVCYQTVGTVSGGSNLGSIDIVVFKLDPTGTVLWTSQRPVFNTSDNDRDPRLVVDQAGNSYVCYRTNGGTVSGGSNLNTSASMQKFVL